MRILVPVLLLATACGTEDKNPASNGANLAPGASQQATPGPSTPQQPSAVEAVYAIAVSGAGDLPACTAANSKQLAYAKTEAKFYSCETSGWSALEIVGAAGPKGDTGATGATGPQGPKGDPGQPTTGNEWADPVTGASWLIGVVTANQSTSAGACTNGWSLPTQDQAVAAVQHGLAVDSLSMSGPSAFWTSTTSTNQCGTGIAICYGIVDQNAATRWYGSAGIACVKQ